VAAALPKRSPLELGVLNSPICEFSIPLGRFVFNMLTIRDEVRAFIHATQLFLSPNGLGMPLNEDEEYIMAMCAQHLAEKYQGRTSPTKWS
jgi:hypothetical protein